MFMLALLSLPAFAQSGLPGVEVIWKKEIGVLRVDPAPGYHLAPDAPAAGYLEIDGRGLEIAGTGSSLSQGLGLSLPGAGPRTVRGELNVSLCKEDGSECRPVELAFIGTIDGRKGAKHLAVTPPDTRDESVETVRSEALSAEEGFAMAAAEGKLVLLDFSAVWCPPCNLLAAEVLHDPFDAEALSGVVVVEIDADRAESWEIKSRYKVGGYPTVVLTRPDGTLIDRLVGYPGEAGFKAWLAQASAATPLSELDLATLTGAEAADAALRLAREGQEEDARSLFDVAEDGVALRMARLKLDGPVEDVRWLADNARPSILEWIWWVDGIELGPEDNAAVRKGLQEALHGAGPLEAAELLYLEAEYGADVERDLLYAASAASLRAGLSGEPPIDRGHYGMLASLYEECGRPDLALEVLEGARTAFPHEFTFHYSVAGLLQREERFEEALPVILAAEALGYGDMRLRATKRHAEILVGMDRPADAIAVLDGVLAQAERPADGVEVRTTRYLDQLDALRQEIEESGL